MGDKVEAEWVKGLGHPATVTPIQLKVGSVKEGVMGVDKPSEEAEVVLTVDTSLVVKKDVEKGKREKGKSGQV